MKNILANKLTYAFLMTGLLSGGIGWAVGSADDDGAVASVNGVKISQDRLYGLLADQGGSDLVDYLITEEIINQESEKKKITVSDADVDKEYQTIVESYGGEEAFLQQIEASGGSAEAVKEELKTNLKIEKLLEPEIDIS